MLWWMWCLWVIHHVGCAHRRVVERTHWDLSIQENQEARVSLEMPWGLSPLLALSSTEEQNCWSYNAPDNQLGSFWWEKETVVGNGHGGCSPDDHQCAQYGCHHARHGILHRKLLCLCVLEACCKHADALTEGPLPCHPLCWQCYLGHCLCP